MRQKILRGEPDRNSFNGNPTAPAKENENPPRNPMGGEDERDVVKMNINSFRSRMLRQGIHPGGSATQGMRGRSEARDRKSSKGNPTEIPRMETRMSSQTKMEIRLAIG